MSKSLMEVQHLWVGTQLYTDGVMMQQEFHPYERNRIFRLAQLPIGCLCQALLQQVDKANLHLTLTCSLYR
jgi:hypothetical protein